MKAAVMSTPILQKRISDLAAKRIEVEEKEGLLNKEDKLFVSKRAQRRACIEQSLQEVAEKLTDDMICKMESKTFIRGAYYLCTELLTRAYHQGMSAMFVSFETHEYHADGILRDTRIQRRGSALARSRCEGGEEKAQHNILTMSSITRRLRLVTSYLLPPGYRFANRRSGRQSEYARAGFLFTTRGYVQITK